MRVAIAMVLAMAFIVAAASATCPTLVCSCSKQEKSANCSSRGLLKPPPGLPSDLVSLDLSRNELETVNTTEIFALADLEELDLSSNMLVNMAFSGVHYKLRKLDLSSNNISSVKSLRIDGLVHLMELNLANNKIISLPPDAFPGGGFLRTLNLKNNRIVSLDEGCMDNLNSLENLILNRNSLSSFPKGLFQNMRSLLVLELNKNKFVEIQGLTFHGLENLKILRFKRNQIEFLMDGAFFGLSNIEELSLDRNKINRVNKGWLYGLSTLRYLSLANNDVDFVDEDAWEFCRVLDKLDLRSNKLQLLDRLTLSRLPSLKHLYLQDNKISHIEGGAGNHDSRTFADVPLLETLALDGNEISHTIEDMEAPFDGLVNVKSISLSNNHIKSIGSRAFLGLDSLETLDIRDNLISTVQENAFQHLTQLRSIMMNSGSILCDCYLKWFPKWLNETVRISNSDVTATCAHPELLKGQFITYVPYESYTCDDFPKPYILKQPETQVTLHGANLTLTCRAASTSPAEMSFLWKVDSDNVDADDSPDCSDRCITYHSHSYDGKGREITAKLHLSNLTYDDAGRYQCVVSNKFGVTYSERANITVYVYPTFIVTPEDITVEAGSSATMKCAAQGVPAPKVFWTKDFGSDFPAARERRIIVNSFQSSDDRMTNVNSFVVRDVKAIDMGIYTCTAKNPAGLISWNITLSVLETPKFVKPMEDKVVTEGDTAVIECMASGSPKPLLTWSKDGTKLEPTERHFFAADNQLLVIVKARLSDAGFYQCLVDNPLGNQTQSSILKVNAFSNIFTTVNGNIGNSGGGEGDQTTGIIIVVVVCCIMGTSLIWTIFCFCKLQRRRRRGNSHDHRGSRGSFAFIGKAADALPLTTDNMTGLQRPIVIANQYTDHQIRRGSNFFDHDHGHRVCQINHEAESHNHNPISFDETRVRVIADANSEEGENRDSYQPPTEKSLLLLQNAIHHDSSSERDSGTGDSRKSRDNLDDEEDPMKLDEEEAVLKVPLVARQGGGESTISLTDFEATGLTSVGDYEFEDEEDGCGEAIPSASNSIAASENSSSRSSASQNAKGQEKSNDEVITSPAAAFRTFHPNRSLSRDFLNNESHHKHRWKQMGGHSKKRASAIELNGENYLVIEHTDGKEPQRDVIDPLVYRGGTAAKRVDGLEFSERLLEHSLNCTDYSLRQSQLVRNSRERASQQNNAYVNSLPRTSSKKKAKYKKMKQQNSARSPPPPKLEVLERSVVPLKDDEMFA